MKFHKVLARHYHGWYRDCWDSAVYCREHGYAETEQRYLKHMLEYFDIIINNWDAIEFFSQGDNAFMIDSALPEQFRGYK